MILHYICIYILSMLVNASIFDSYPAFLPKGPEQSAENLELVSLFQSRSLQNNQIFSTAIQLLESMKSSRSCSRVAATKLLTSCQGLSNSDKSKRSDVATALDKIKSVYAARLALCELTGAGAPIPMPCSLLHITPDKLQDRVSLSSEDSMDSLSPTAIESCLKTLESRPQWWTSYSNSRQNAIVICQAARIEVEKEEMLHLHQSLAENMANLNRGLQDSLRDAVSEGIHHKEFVETVYDLRAQLMAELQEDQNRARGIFANLYHELEASVGLSISKILSLLRDVELDTVALNKEMQGSTQGIDQLNSHLRDLYNGIEQQNSKIKETYERDARDMQSSYELAVAMRSSLNDIGKSVAGVDGALEWLVERFAAIQQQESFLIERMHSFEAHLEKSNHQAKELLETQTMQVKTMETQARAQASLSASTKAANTLLDKLTTRAAKIESVLEETASRFDDISSLGSFFGVKVSAWTISSLLFSVIAVQNPRVAVILLVFSGITLIYKATLIVMPIIFPASLVTPAAALSTN
ncbi:putative nuclear membrane fusion protein Kar5 [Talaromyces proteolyticus]|uniref:Nuclear membrane fusion protein Kar5 n=1 Tax=Talaromyces proteolyticus TaxID=1131652 RepID=A0AAD4L2V5_9EURO|nr:putative nuclear membrane fusion protein Kar5 [Talaromyces proteolyticus]KAH8704917.1 putative nuclear membrane fusion protein Kar5 [Talaromyces proteolyticus]